ncbi:hypothetical protein Ae706Ps2_6576c [Pseudonocardia sp. Ae706_Ps2]|nr:hypothetical protein Ae706Ps2_6576c [Pseudonocardia sp. Ae706_Ps2]
MEGEFKRRVVGPLVASPIHEFLDVADTVPHRRDIGRIVVQVEPGNTEQ